MQLIGMLDSPYVRRTAVSLHALGLSFRHRSVSVFRTYDRFREINPVVKAPTLVCDDGTVLMDSTLILDYAEALAAPKSLMPRGITERLAALRLIGLALAACEKTVQIVYERNLRPADKQHEPWVARLAEQLRTAYQQLESDLTAHPRSAGDSLGAAEIATAVAWRFTQEKLPGLIAGPDHPQLLALSSWAERQPPFVAWPYEEITLHV
jgi:glutathione S-transferase